MALYARACGFSSMDFYNIDAFDVSAFETTSSFATSPFAPSSPSTVASPSSCTSENAPRSPDSVVSTADVYRSTAPVVCKIAIRGKYASSVVNAIKSDFNGIADVATTSRPLAPRCCWSKCARKATHSGYCTKHVSSVKRREQKGKTSMA